MEPQRLRLVDEHAEDPPPARQVANGGSGLWIETSCHEALELRAARIDDPKGRVPGTGQFGRGLGEPLEKRIE